MNQEPGKLKRSVTLPVLILYGLGTMVGGGFYALLGKVAGETGFLAPATFALSGGFALLVGLAFAEAASRFPVSAGEARYVGEGFGHALFPIVTGMLVIVTGIVSAAALSVATIGFLQDLVSVPEKISIVVLVLTMGGLAIWGIGQSVAVVAAMTVIEIGALIYVVFVADWEWGQISGNWRNYVPALEGSVWVGIFSGAFLSIYAFIGFEDMVNMAEEVEDPPRALPVAIVVSIVATTVLYVIVALVAVTAVPPDKLAGSNTPIAEMVGGQGWFSKTGLVVVSMLTGLNGALVQIIMASRVAYGLADRGQAPSWLAVVHPKTRTPIIATLIIMGVILLLALFFPLTTLAKITSGIILVVFGAVNLALWRIKRRDPDLDGVGPRLPNWVPLAGSLSCLFVLAFQLWLVLK